MDGRTYRRMDRRKDEEINTQHMQVNYLLRHQIQMLKVWDQRD